MTTTKCDCGGDAVLINSVLVHNGALTERFRCPDCNAEFDEVTENRRAALRKFYGSEAASNERIVTLRKMVGEQMKDHAEFR